MMISFTIPIKPVAWQRPRFNGKVGYTAKKVSKFEETISLYAKKAMGSNPPTKDMVTVTVKFFYKRPEKFPKYIKERIDRGEIVAGKPTRPDIDNLAKGVLDAMNGIVYVDDGQVVEINISKLYSNQEEVYVFLNMGGF
jgi:Holliday junction resolvase RusA-like endonuclease